MKQKLVSLIFLALFVFPRGIFAQTADIKVAISIPKDEKGVQIIITNIASDTFYTMTSTVSAVDGYTKKKEGVVDPSGQKITQLFTELTPKKAYSVTILGTPVSGTGKNFGPVTYTFETNFAKPGISESLAGSGNNQTPDTINPPQLPDNGTGNNNNNQTNKTPNNTTSGTTLTPEEIAADKKGSGLVPCTDTCDLNDVLQLINNIIVFLIKDIFIPIIILLFIYAGYQYITAQGNPAKIANLKKLLWRIIVGMVLVLCAWLIVKTIISILSSEDSGALQFLK